MSDEVKRIVVYCIECDALISIEVDIDEPEGKCYLYLCDDCYDKIGV